MNFALCQSFIKNGTWINPKVSYPSRSFCFFATPKGLMILANDFPPRPTHFFTAATDQTNRQSVNLNHSSVRSNHRKNNQTKQDVTSLSHNLLAGPRSWQECASCLSSTGHKGCPQMAVPSSHRSHYAARNSQQPYRRQSSRNFCSF